MTTRKIFSRNLSRLLQERGIKAELARYCSVEQSTVKFWAEGTNLPSAENLDKIAAFLSINVSELFTEQPLSAKERELLIKFHRLNDKGKESALGMLDVLLSNADFAEESA